MTAWETSELFVTLKPEERPCVCAVIQERSFAPGQEIFRKADPSDGRCIVASGLVEISGQIAQKPASFPHSLE